MSKVKKAQKPKSLSHGRPPVIQKPKASLTAKATRTLIRTHHRLHKALAEAVKHGDEQTAASIRAQIEEKGGLKRYQQASIQGQSSDRGGDTSKLLMDWLPKDISKAGAKLRMLEVGALSVNNVCSRSGVFDDTRIDLNSQGSGIQQQDFMERPLPTSEDEKFDIISLSLVLNYVPDASQRGEMLRRTCQFLLSEPSCALSGEQMRFFPSLFLVLPAPCVTNSRYLDEKLLTQIMKTLGYSLIERKLTAKLIYHLWHWNGLTEKARFAKSEVNPGRSRNNFSVILE
ncbi:hypothetical protein AAFC00_003419 [Neodothiora populina]|uniref:25S rRNA adenine-N(1) methyltransferase n=1 Tax=Neodothiora populina TaxID=2781224 RepID=A0ABR3PE60_9PEZI